MNLKSTILLIVIVVVGGLMFYLAFNYKSANTNQANTNQTINGEQKVATVSVDQANEQFTYTNVEFDYKITFPSDWEYDQDSESSRAVFFDDVALKQTTETELQQGMKIEVYAEPIQDEVTLETEYQKLTESIDGAILEKTEVIVNTLPAFKVKMDELGYAIATHVIKGNRLYTLAGYIGSSDDVAKYTARYSNIVSTMIFLD